MDKDRIEKMEDGKDKELMIIVSDGKPYKRKCDGYAKKVEEDKEITYKDYQDQENVLKVPAGSYVVLEKDSCCPKIIPAEEFEEKNTFIDKGEKKSTKEDKVKIGLETQM